MTESGPARAIKLNPVDNVAVSVAAMQKGQQLEGEYLECNDDIPRGHKIATDGIPSGGAIRKYNQIIGIATRDIRRGDHVHSHNCAMDEFDRDYAFCADARPAPESVMARAGTFQGFVRENGRVGTRNYIGLVTSVNCSASVARFIADSVEKQGLLADYPNIDGIVPIVHGSGCCMSASGEAFDTLSRTLWGYASHPNFGAILMLGLGCEVMQIPRFLEEYGVRTSDRFRVMTIQAGGGTRKTVDAGIEAVGDMLPKANLARRQSAPVSGLTLALQCGGSDAYSGITANPALGQAVDRLVQGGGTAILSETPEIYGAEHLLTRRAVSEEVGKKLLQRIQWWKEYTHRNHMEMDNNPTPGNKQGGLTTILEKSLGAVAKGGTSNLNDVYLYGELVRSKGFVFMDSPGFDPCSITGQVASGANMICFTTGRGSVYGFKPVPSIKLATNTPMYERMREDMDINCGDIVDGGASVEQKGEEIFDYIVSIASGTQSRSEALGFGDSEFVPWQTGAVM